jgi:hypothetical protein
MLAPTKVHMCTACGDECRLKSNLKQHIEGHCRRGRGEGSGMEVAIMEILEAYGWEQGLELEYVFDQGYVLRSEKTNCLLRWDF